MVEEGEFKKRIEEEMAKTVEISSHKFDLDLLSELVDEVKKEYLDCAVIGIALQSTHTGKRGRPKSKIKVKISGFTLEEQVQNLKAELQRKDEFFAKWFGE